MKVQTSQGLIERAELEVKDLIEESDNARITVTIWRYKGALVRRDVHLNVLRSPEIGVKHGE